MIVVFALLWVRTRAIENFKPSNASTVRFVYLLQITLTQKYFYSSVFGIFLVILRDAVSFEMFHIAFCFVSFLPMLPIHLSQGRQSAKLLLQSMELGFPYPLTHPLLFPGRVTLACGRWVWGEGSQIRHRVHNTVLLYFA